MKNSSSDDGLGIEDSCNEKVVSIGSDGLLLGLWEIVPKLRKSEDGPEAQLWIRVLDEIEADFEETKVLLGQKVTLEVLVVFEDQ